MVDAHSSLGWLLATARLVCDYEKKGKWQTANNNNTEMMWNVLEQCTEWQRMNCLIAFLVCDISWGHNYCVQMILWRHTHTHSRSEANWNNKWINYLHLVRSSMECVNEKSTQLAACGIYVICTDSVRHNDNNVDGMDLRIRCSDVRCTPHRIQFVVLIIVCVCICSIAFAFDCYWTNDTTCVNSATAATMPLPFANALKFGCWFYDFSLFHRRNRHEMR